jgi:hypothetical protein
VHIPAILGEVCVGQGAARAVERVAVAMLKPVERYNKTLRLTSRWENRLGLIQYYVTNTKMKDYFSNLISM